MSIIYEHYKTFYWNSGHIIFLLELNDRPQLTSDPFISLVRNNRESVLTKIKQDDTWLIWYYRLIIGVPKESVNEISSFKFVNDVYFLRAINVVTKSQYLFHQLMDILTLIIPLIKSNELAARYGMLVLKFGHFMNREEVQTIYTNLKNRVGFVDYLRANNKTLLIEKINKAIN
jgi:hypothetical protein